MRSTPSLGPAAPSLCLLLGFLAGVGAWRLPQVARLGRHTPRMADVQIVGGNITEQGQFPSMISIQHRSLWGSVHVCGGSLLNDNHVLTAAHCVKGYSGSSFNLVAGEQNLEKESGLEQTRRSEHFVMHDFSTTTGANDIALIRASSGFELVDGLVELAPLPYDYEEPDEGTKCTAVGWGFTQDSGEISNDLRYVDLPYLTDVECQSIFGDDAILLDMLCAGYMGGKGVCGGDSGGPLYCDGVQQGIVSWGAECDANPAVFTQVSHYLDWIKLNSDS
ncbi:trypsin-1-like [Homarus americanus]|uniref:Trypsin I-P1-like n=1 Tax=Homarus americanus TaxID=6706 RepID=A0A8J5N1T2_HOMAM|nr:trypsin-1-like [Homarus americanus]KAG7171718.1 Trypsin I-P1-like [Homarus americanus]